MGGFILHTLVKKTMYIQEVSIDVKTKKDMDELVEEFNLLLSFYRGSGQLQGRIESQYINEARIIGLPFTLEKDSLDAKNNNFYVTRQLEKLEDLCKSKIKIETKGKTYQSYKAPCICKSPKYYILATNYTTIESPINCGTCNKSVPLYRLPKLKDYGYMPILSWESNYIACDHLQMNCEVGEKWALNQMEKFNSTLSKQGRTICRTIEEQTKIPTYYYLYNYNLYKNDTLKRTCPSCNQKWDLKKPEHNLYEFKCQKCRLLSNISPNSN